MTRITITKQFRAAFDAVFPSYDERRAKQAVKNAYMEAANRLHQARQEESRDR